MSGGSFNYLCHQSPGQVIDSDDLDAMSEELDDLRSLGSAPVIDATDEVIALRKRLGVLTRMLEKPWRAVEWRASGDYGDDQVKRAFNDFYELHLNEETMDPATRKSQIEIVYQAICDMCPRRVNEGEQADIRREAEKIIDAIPSVSIRIGDTNIFLHGTARATAELQELMGRREQAAHDAADKIDIHLANVAASVGPDDSPLDDPVEAASISLDLLRQVRGIIEPLTSDDIYKTSASASSIEAINDEQSTGGDLLSLLKVNDRDLRDEILREIIDHGPNEIAPAIAAWYKRRCNVLIDQPDS